MTNVWGPLAWMTLHSISLNYPDTPAKEDKEILNRFMSFFADTISCPHCKTHFAIMFESYKARHPDWSSSRYKFFLFVVRVHNSVNRRLDKPVIPTVADCLTTISNNTKMTNARTYREKYLQYLLGNWTREVSPESFMMTRTVREMMKINNQYWNLRDGSQQVFFPEADIVTPIEATKGPRGNALPGLNPSGVPINVGFRLKGGRLSLGSR